jgi:hypothetical protein
LLIAGVIFILILSCIIGFESGFTGFRGFLALEISLDGARSSQLFESGFTGFRGFFSLGHWLR